MTCIACGGTGQASKGGKCRPCNGKNYLFSGEKKMIDLQQLFGGSGFDTHSVEPQQDFTALPPGKYPVIVEKAEVKPTKAQTGHYLEITMSVLDGQFKNRKLWDRINIQNPSTQCVEIGLRSLAALGQALGLTSVQSTDQLLNGVCIAHVKVKDEQNEVRTYSAIPKTQGYVEPQRAPAQSLQENAASMPGPVNQPTTGGVKPPWAR